MNCIIVDDDAPSQQVLEEYVKTVPYIRLIARCNNAFEAYNVLRTQKVDLILLDIAMPNITGVEFIKTLEHAPMFIFVTASTEHAIEAFTLNAIDYLVKPIAFDRFIKAINKAYEVFTLKRERITEPVHLPEPKRSEGFILVKSEYQTLRVDLTDITYIEGLKDYIKIFLVTGKPIVTLNSLKNMADRLPDGLFLRVHKSYIVSLNKISSIVRNRIVIGEKWIPIGENHKAEFFETIQKHDLKL